MNVSMLMSVAAGGAVGAVGRYIGMSLIGHTFGHGYPLGTLVVNVIGSLVLGFLVDTMALVWSPTIEMRGFLVVGVLGAFTTFSTFSLDVVTLIQRNELGSAAGYVIASVVFGIAAFFAGMALARSLF